MANDLFPRITTMGEVATPASSQLQEVININQRVYVLSTHHKGERCPERDYLAAKLRRVLASKDFTEKLGRKLTAWDNSQIWHIAQGFWSLMASGRAMQTETRDVLRAAVDGEESFFTVLQRVYGRSAYLCMRKHVHMQIALHMNRRPHLGNLKEANERYFVPLMLIACALISSQEEVGR